MSINRRSMVRLGDRRLHPMTKISWSRRRFSSPWRSNRSSCVHQRML